MLDEASLTRQPEEVRGHSTLHAGKVLGLLTTVLVLDPPNLVCRDLFGSYNCGLKGFHFGDLQFYSVILSILSKNGPKLPEILKIGSKINVHQNENPSNHSCMTQKDPYIPILVGLGPKLWSVTLKLCQRAKLSVPFIPMYSKNIFSQAYSLLLN